MFIFEKMKKYRIAVVDDHTILLDGLRWLISQFNFVEVVKAYTSGPLLIQDILAGTSYNLVVTDLQMPEFSGHELIDWLKQNSPETKILVMTMFDSPFVFKKVMASRADGFFVKNGDGDKLELAMLTILDGGSYFPEETSLFQEHQDTYNAVLTKRESEILKHIAHDKSSKKIAEELFISEDTVLTHRKNIMQKLKIHSTAGLVAFALKNNMV
jgi:DNA-binding NarL/FixJ family response regulator